MGTDVSSFNVSLTPDIWNSTGNGTLCVPKVPLPASLKVNDGDKASIQVVTFGETGAALYNCADIKFSKDAKGPEACKTDNVTYYVIGEVQNKVESDGDVPEASGSNSSDSSSDSSSSSSSNNGSTGGSGGTGGALGRDVPVAVLSAVVGLAFAFAAGMSL
jgi:BIM1-like copper acquisition factor